MASSIGRDGLEIGMGYGWWAFRGAAPVERQD